MENNTITTQTEVLTMGISEFIQDGIFDAVMDYYVDHDITNYQVTLHTDVKCGNNLHRIHFSNNTRDEALDYLLECQSSWDTICQVDITPTKMTVWS